MNVSDGDQDGIVARINKAAFEKLKQFLEGQSDNILIRPNDFFLKKK